MHLFSRKFITQYSLYVCMYICFLLCEKCHYYSINQEKVKQIQEKKYKNSWIYTYCQFFKAEEILKL